MRPTSLSWLGQVRHTGKHGAKRSALVLEELPSIDIRELKRFGFLESASRATVDWKIQDQALGTVVVECAGQRISIIYPNATARDTQGSQQQSIALVYTHPHLGGSRPWFVCPECGQRCAIIYFDRLFKCRRCTRRHYYCQRVDERHRLLAGLLNLRWQLMGRSQLEAFTPARPKGMHRSRYKVLASRYEHLQAKLQEAERRYFGLD